MDSMPNDFTVRYKWREGSVPPPYYYEYTISVSRGSAGKIDFLPDYPIHDPPVWTETFDVAGEALNRLYTLMVEKGVFTKSWTEIDDGRIGGSLQWMELTVGGEEFLVPSVIEEAGIIKEVYDAIKALVPQGIWDALMAQREQFQRSYLEEQE